MNSNSGKSLVAFLILICLVNATAQTKRHYIPNRGIRPENGNFSGLGGGSIDVQNGASVQPTAVPKTITITGTYKTIKLPTSEASLAKEKKAVGTHVVNSIRNPATIAFTPALFESHAIELVKDLYVTDATGENPILGYDLEERDGDIVKIAKLFLVNSTAPSKEVLIKAFENGESFLVLRKVPVETTCGMCEGKGVVQTAEIIFKERSAELRFAECTRCHGTKKITFEIAHLFKVVLK